MLALPVVLGLVANGVGSLFLPPEVRANAALAVFFYLTPALAGVLLLLAIAALPALVQPFRMQHPLHLTLPIVHSALLLVSSGMITQMPTVLERPPDQLETTYLWSSPGLLLAVMAAQCAVLSLWSWLAGRRRRHTT